MLGWALSSGVGLGFGFWCQTLCSVDEVWVERIERICLTPSGEFGWERIERICLTPSGEFGWAGLSESV